MTHLLAVDAGGTSTRAVVLTTDGVCRGYGTAGSGNPVSSGTAHAALQVATATAAALAQAGVAAIDATTVLAMAGSRVHTTSDWVAPALSSCGVSGPIAFESDILAMFCTGAWERDGYGIVAGTGAAAIRVHDGRPDRSADGLGWLIGDDGSGFWIGRRVVRVVAAQLDGRGAETALTPLLLESLDIPFDTRILDPEDGRSEALKGLAAAVYALRPIELARFAPLIFRAGDDEAALQIAQGARDALAASLAALDSADVRGPVVCGGGVLGALGLDADGLVGATDVRQVGDGVVGACVLALRDNGLDVDRTVFDGLRETLGPLRA